MPLTWFSELSLFVQFVIFVIVFLVGLKLYLTFTMGICKSKKRLDGKTVIVTGSNCGIGKETARDLAQRGAKVILACRNLAKASEAKDDIIATTGNKNVVVKELDLASLKSVRKFAAEILTSEPRLDILINNAGCAALGKTMTEDGLELQMQSNHFGHFLLTNLLLRLLVRTKDSRIVVVSALAHVFFDMDIHDLNFTTKEPGFFEIYSTSKLCNILFTRELARKLQDSGYENITVNALHPGIIVTEFGRFIGEKLQRLSLAIAQFFFKTAKEGAQTTIYLAVADEVAYMSGEYFSDCKVAKTSKAAQDEGLARKLWELSESMVQLKEEERFF